MRKTTKILGAVAIAGLLAAGSAAFTASGLSLDGSGNAQYTHYVGGTQGLSVVGATLKDVAYDQDSTTGLVNQIDLVFSSPASIAGAPVTITFDGGAATAGPAWTCTTVNGTTGDSTCGNGTTTTVDHFVTLNVTVGSGFNGS